eukprot:SAG25_NODE_4695_length_766_cov_1.146927_1_plen_85_part_10
MEAATPATQRPTKVKSMTLASGSSYGVPGSAVLAVTSRCGGSVAGERGGHQAAQGHLRAVGATTTLDAPVRVDLKMATRVGYDEA